MQSHQQNCCPAMSSKSTQQPPQWQGHIRRPSIGKSMPVTALMLNFPPPPSESRSYSSLSRDGLSPDVEKPPIYFHLSDVNELKSDERLDFADHPSYEPYSFKSDEIVIRNNSKSDEVALRNSPKSDAVAIRDSTKLNELAIRDSDASSLIQEGSITLQVSPCLICTASTQSSNETDQDLKPESRSPLTELCGKLCNADCRQIDTKDVEDLGKALSAKCRSTGEAACNRSTVIGDCGRDFLRVPSKLDEQRMEFLNDMLSDCGETIITCNNGKSAIDDNQRFRGSRCGGGAGCDASLDCAPAFDIKDFREKFQIAEALAKASMMTSPAAKRRLAARKVEMELDSDANLAGSDDDGDFIPPRQLLLYLVRMGSFNSAPKINNTDSQDDTLEVPQGLTVTDMVQHCKIMRGENRPGLLTRYFLKPMSKDAIFSNDITEGLRVLKLNAVSKVCSAPVSSPKHLRLLQWNILSQSLGQNNDGFVRCPDEALTWENRKYLIVEEIIQNNPDIICLQEVDHFKFLERVLGTQNYSGIFFPKPDSPCLYIQENNGPDGCAIFFKQDKFELVNYDTRVLEVWRVQSNQVAIAANIRVKETGKEITVCTTHLKARNGALLSKLRNEQGKDLCRFVNDFAEDRPILLCGDFNAEPIEPVYNTVLNFKGLNLSSAYAEIGAEQEMSNMNNNKDDENDENVDDSVIQSAAEISASREPPYTTWKIREEGEVCHTIDYVFFSKDHLKVNNCLLFPQENEIGQNRTPSFQYPSDHFSLVCDFELLDNVDY